MSNKIENFFVAKKKLHLKRILRFQIIGSDF